ncbi:MAG: DNA adenine methylase, partial [Burkholderiales bacterium]
MIKTIRQPQIANDNGNNMDIRRAISGVITKYPIQQSFDFAFNFQPDIEDYNDNLIKLESRRYIGNKSKLANWIIETILTQTGNCNSFFDIFAGTATVSKRAFDYFKKVVVNDILYSNNVIHKAFFEVGIWDRKKIEDLLWQYNILNPNDLRENYFSENFGGKFFDYNNAKIIGYIREDIENKKAHLTEKEYSILLATLIYNIDKIANTVGHFDAYIKKPFQNQKLQLRLIETIDFDGIEIHKENANSLA